LYAGAALGCGEKEDTSVKTQPDATEFKGKRKEGGGVAPVPPGRPPIQKPGEGSQ